MGAVWPRANAPSGPTIKAQMRKLSVWMSFIVANAILHSTFLAAVMSVYSSFSTRVARIS